MRKKARIIAKLAAKYRALAFFVNGRSQKPAPGPDKGRRILPGFTLPIVFVNTTNSETGGAITLPLAWLPVCNYGGHSL
jgi:hypothetical protein